jgi:DNA mismatch endonuclease (patch repair protein)
VRRLPGKPDLVFGPARLAVFVHGCFWHGCPNCDRNLTPRTNAAYWQAKFAQNRERDSRNRANLEAMGYRVLVLWECEAKASLPDAVDRIREALAAQRAIWTLPSSTPAGTPNGSADGSES